MIQFQRAHVINATPDSVWAVLGRFMHIDEFAPLIESVEALTDGEDGMGSRRRNHFANGTSVVEEVTGWEVNQKYCVRLSEMDAMPLHEAHAEISVEPVDDVHSTVKWTFKYRMKYGLLGWLLGQTMMKMMMGKILEANLKGLAENVENNQTATAQAI